MCTKFMTTYYSLIFSLITLSSTGLRRKISDSSFRVSDVIIGGVRENKDGGIAHIKGDNGFDPILPRSDVLQFFPFD